MILYYKLTLSTYTKHTLLQIVCIAYANQYIFFVKWNRWRLIEDTEKLVETTSQQEPKTVNIMEFSNLYSTSSMKNLIDFRIINI